MAESDIFLAFMQEVLGGKPLYRSADHMGALSINIFKEGYRKYGMEKLRERHGCSSCVIILVQTSMYMSCSFLSLALHQVGARLAF
jgi:hypothetical protein